MNTAFSEFLLLKLHTIIRSLVEERINIAEAHYGSGRAETKLAKYLVVTH